MKRPKPLCEWDGYVESIGTDSFEATVFEVGPASPEAELATIPLTLLSKRDRAKIQLGSYIKWEVYEGRSRVWLRRWRWSKKEIADATREAHDLWLGMRRSLPPIV